MADKEKNLIGEFLSKIKNHRLIWPIIVFGLIIIGLSKFTNAIQDINKFLFPIDKKTIKHSSEINDKTNLESIDIKNQSDSKILNSSSQIFEKSNPYPINYNKVKIGTKLSMIKNYYSKSEGSLNYDGTWFSINSDGNIFKRIVFYLEENQEDPKVYMIVFWANDSNYMTEIKKQAITALDTINFKSFSLGKVLEWSNIKGIKVTIDDESYGIKKSHNNKLIKN